MKRVKIKMGDLIVLLPGIIGSVLKKDGKELWSPSFSAIFNAVTHLGKNLEGLNLQGDDPEIEDLEDGVTADRLMPDAVIVPGLVKIDGYTRLSEMIKRCFDVKEGRLNADEKPSSPANYFEFPYDWRRDNRVAARRLKQLIDLRLPQWQEYAGKKARVILIAHSMGGIVARYYLEALGGREKCKALITLGTPYGGSLNALDFLANGYSNYLAELSKAMATFTSVYQLLPIYQAVISDSGRKKVSGLNIKNVDQKRVKEASDFHCRIMDEVDTRIKGGDKEPYIILPVAGTYQPTLQSADLFEDELTVSQALPPDVDKLLWHGDGTVPYLSATPHELRGSLRNSTCVETHGELQCNNQVLDFIYDRLAETQIIYPSFRGGRLDGVKRAAISLHVNDLYTDDEPIIMRARIFKNDTELVDIDHFRKEIAPLLAIFESVDRPGDYLEGQFTPYGEEWRLESAPLRPSVYRVEVRTAKEVPTAPLPVHDLFEVVAKL